MLWYLEPKAFPRDKDKDEMMCVFKMHRRCVSQHMTVVINTKGNDYKLEPMEELKEFWNKPQRCTDDAEEYFLSIFGDDYAVWLEHCNS